MCDRRIRNGRASRSANLHQCACPFYRSHAGYFFLAKHHITEGCQHPYSTDFAPCHFWFFPKLKSPLKVRRFVNPTGHTVHKLSQRRLTADFLGSREIDCSRIRSKVSSDLLPSYIKVTRRVLVIFKMAGYFPDSLVKDTSISRRIFLTPNDGTDMFYRNVGKN